MTTGTWWAAMDAKLWSQAVAFVAESLAEVDPENAAAFRANAERYRAELDELARRHGIRVLGPPPGLGRAGRVD